MPIKFPVLKFLNFKTPPWIICRLALPTIYCLASSTGPLEIKTGLSKLSMNADLSIDQLFARWQEESQAFRDFLSRDSAENIPLTIDRDCLWQMGKSGLELNRGRRKSSSCGACRQLQPLLNFNQAVIDQPIEIETGQRVGQFIQINRVTNSGLKVKKFQRTRAQSTIRVVELSSFLLEYATSVLLSDVTWISKVYTVFLCGPDVYSIKAYYGLLSEASVNEVLAVKLFHQLLSYLRILQARRILHRCSQNKTYLLDQETLILDQWQNALITLDDLTVIPIDGHYGRHVEKISSLPDLEGEFLRLNGPQMEVCRQLQSQGVYVGATIDVYYLILGFFRLASIRPYIASGLASAWSQCWVNPTEAETALQQLDSAIPIYTILQGKTLKQQLLSQF